VDLAVEEAFSSVLYSNRLLEHHPKALLYFLLCGMCHVQYLSKRKAFHHSDQYFDLSAHLNPPFSFQVFYQMPLYLFDYSGKVDLDCLENLALVGHHGIDFLYLVHHDN
jgi:hypothetical protein